MFGQKKNKPSFKVLFIAFNITLFIVILLISFNVNEISRYVQKNEIDNILAELNEGLDINETDVFETLVYDNEMELIIIDSDTLVYTSNGFADISYADKVYERGFVYKAIYDYDEYTVWVAIYKTSVFSTINLVIAIFLGILAIAFLVSSIFISRFFSNVTRPLLQLSNLILDMKKNKEIINNKDLDDIAQELLLIYTSSNFDLINTKKDYQNLQNIYDSQRHYIVEQNEHLKTVLHDIKNPLASIRTSSFLLSESSSLSSEDKKVAQSIENASERVHDYIVETLRLVIENIFDIYDSVEDVNVSSTIEELYEANTLYLSNKNVSIGYNTSSVNVHTNILKFNHLITNIVYNSIKYVKPSTIIDVEVTENYFKVKNQISDEIIHGQGFGLNRVNTIADELGFSLDIEEKNNAYSITVYFGEV